MEKDCYTSFLKSLFYTTVLPQARAPDPLIRFMRRPRATYKLLKMAVITHKEYKITAYQIDYRVYKVDK